MARYIDPTGTKFWEIERDGATIVRRSGKLGSKGRAQSHSYASAVHARHEYRSIVGRKTWTEKYTPEALPSPRAVDDFPTDDDAVLVYADALQQKGDPFGELIAMQHGQARADFHASQKMQREIDELLDANAPVWFGDLWQARGLFEWHWRPGRLRHVKLEPDEVIDWKVQIARLLPDVPLCYLLGALLEALFDLDIARSLEELDVSTAGTLDMQDTVKTIALHAPPTLRRLGLTRSRGSNVAYEYGGALYAMRFPALEEFRCDFELSTSSIEHIASADWPKLQSLSFAMHGYDDARATVDVGEQIAALAPLLANPGALRSIEIKTPQPSLLAQVIPNVGAWKHVELVIRSKRPIDPAIEARLLREHPKASFIQMPAYSMRPG